MYEPYLNREKQYLKMNADLDNRFKEVDQIKNDGPDMAKPRLNVFGNGSKANNQNAKSAKPKRTEVKSKTLGDAVNQNVVREIASSVRTIVKSADKPQKSKPDPAATSRSSLENDCFSERKSSAHIDTVTSVVINRTQDDIIGTTSNRSVTLATGTDAPVKKNISSDGLIKFLKSKVAIVKQELELSQQENVKNLRAYESSLELNKKHAAQMDQVTNENDGLKAQVDKLQKSINIYEAVEKEKDADLATLNQEIAALKKQLKEVNRLHSGLERRLLKCQDDLEHAKKNLGNSQDSERQQRAVNHQQKNFFEDQIKTLSRQRTGLLSAYKKQLLLLDNLKRQNLCLEQSKLLQLAEKDFMKVLDWNN